MNSKSIILILTCICWGVELSAQQPQREIVGITLGVEMRSLLNPNVFNLDSTILIDPAQNFRAVYRYSGGFGFGGIVRVKLTDLWNIETGINYTRRNYSIRINDLQTPFVDETEVRLVGYEIPLKALIYVQLGKKIFVDVAMGGSVDFFASDISSLQQYYNFRAFKRGSFAKGALIASLGVEYRTEEDGYFYIGSTFHQTIGDIMITEVNYYRENDLGQPAYVGRQRGVLDGAYFSVDFRYFFPVQKPRKQPVRYIIPDWKNM